LADGNRQDDQKEKNGDALDEKQPEDPLKAVYRKSAIS
jgi:hypothetical protein